MCIDTSLDQDKEHFRSSSKVKVKWANNSTFQTVYRIIFPFTDRLWPNSTKRSTSTPAWIKTKKIPGQDQRSKANGSKTLFFRRCIAYLFHLPADCTQTAPDEVHQHKLGLRQRKFQVKVKGQGPMVPKLDFLDGVPHNSFIYQPMAPKQHQQKRSDISLDQNKENSRSRSRINVKWAKNRFFSQCTI